MEDDKTDAPQSANGKGNLLDFTVSLARLACAARVPWTLENPERSRAWICRPIKPKQFPLTFPGATPRRKEAL